MTAVRLTEATFTVLYGMKIAEVRGLNVFYINDVEVNPKEDPRFRFILDCFGEARSVAALAHADPIIPGRTDAPTLTDALGFSMTAVNPAFIQGRFHYSDQKSEGSYVIKDGKEWLNKILESDFETLDHLTSMDGLGFAVSFAADDIHVQLINALENSNCNLRSLIEANDLFLWFDGDGDCIHIGCDPKFHGKWMAALDRVSDQIYNNPWIKNNQENLRWDWYGACCLVPESELELPRAQAKTLES